MRRTVGLQYIEQSFFSLPTHIPPPSPLSFNSASKTCLLKRQNTVKGETESNVCMLGLVHVDLIGLDHVH